MAELISREEAVKAIGEHLDRINGTPAGAMEGVAKLWLSNVPTLSEGKRDE